MHVFPPLPLCMPSDATPPPERLPKEAGTHHARSKRLKAKMSIGSVPSPLSPNRYLPYQPLHTNGTLLAEN